ncbi:hypothetical protein CYY_009157 [Polysphondylium violaceum]|uniref:Uncharacterized protein n=1 Tax=Polysphondylium violaceum TaxID=133409 RepID=A0A8J4PM29_9MYCE|nr:hypothetical protein CYY_009157 [Polysphondylium violaceum]
MKFLTLAFLMIMVTLASAVCTNPSGFRSTFTSTSFNLGNGGSSYETGLVNIDFAGQRASSVFEYYAENGKTYSGFTFSFAANQTSYLMGFDGKCYEATSSTPIPSGWPTVIQDIGSYTVGVFPVELYEVQSDSADLNQSVLFDLDNCVLVSSYLANADQTNPGFGTINFLNVGVPSDSDFQLPQACIDVVGSSKPMIGLNHKRNTNIQVSKVLDHVLNAMKF